MLNEHQNLSFRNEHKYILSLEQYTYLKQHLECIQAPHKYIVNSIYFDTSSLSSYQEKADGDWKKIKLRQRWYGNNAPFFEIKYKEGNKNKKYRFDNLQKAHTFMSSLSSATQLFHSTKQVHVRYLREGYQLSENLRITFDSELIYQDLVHGHSSTRLIYIMEIKGKETPEWVKAFCHCINITPARFSKYADSLKALRSKIV
tara:strand:+ start:40051 stop:40656 length:606 start_codon:yes stop_codon:yes gene_type:complete